jgi:ribonuclease/clavin/mitogillin
MPSLQILHTPGHTSDSVCLYLREDRALFTADTILGHGTAVFEDLAAYFASLHKMIYYHKTRYGNDSESNQIKVLYPGHGPVVTDGAELISTYIKHRLEREAQIIQVLKSPSMSPPKEDQSAPTASDADAWTTWAIVSTIYAAYPVSLWLPAARSVTLHLHKLEDEGKVRRLGGEGVNTKWELVSTS